MAKYNTRLSYEEDDLINIQVIGYALEKAGYSVSWGGDFSVTKVLLTLARLEVERLENSPYPPPNNEEEVG